jgi:hypothetical protein
MSGKMSVVISGLKLEVRYVKVLFEYLQVEVSEICPLPGTATRIILSAFLATLNIDQVYNCPRDNYTIR